MAAQVSGDPRPKLGDPDHPTAEEARAAYESYLAYGGTYVFDAARSVVTHHIELSMEPADVGDSLQREVRLEGSRVVLLADP